jgi:hypothetical protein
LLQNERIERMALMPDECCIGTNARNFFPQKLETIFFVTNNSKMFKDEIKKVNKEWIFYYWVGSTFLFT